MKMTQEELVTEAIKRFGPDQENWSFACPVCQDTTTASDFRDIGQDPNRLGQECIGRYMGAVTPLPTTDGGRSRAERGCDFVAYGLISAPWEILTPEGESLRSFALAEVFDDEECVFDPSS